MLEPLAIVEPTVLPRSPAQLPENRSKPLTNMYDVLNLEDVDDSAVTQELVLAKKRQQRKPATKRVKSNDKFELAASTEDL